MSGVCALSDWQILILAACPKEQETFLVREAE